MKFMIGLIILCTALFHFSLFAQYKWIDADGRIVYSDRPPPGAKPVPIKNIDSNAENNNELTLPYELARTARNYPVTLYSTKDCDPCDEGRQLLQKRGIPFTEKKIASNADIAVLKQVSGQTSLPVLTVGTQKLTEFEAGQWNQALDLAGYPNTSQLPNGYKNPASNVMPAAKSDAEKKEGENNEVRTAPPNVSTVPPPQPLNAPPGFRF